MSIFIVRHGQTNDNAKRILQRPESPLSVTGHQQAKRLAKRLADEPLTRIISSDYLRTKQTAEHLSSLIGVEPDYNAVLRERNFGDLRGIAYADVGADPFAPNFTPPGGESWPEFYLRIASAWEQIVRALCDTQQSLLVVTHGLVCDALVKNHLSLPAEIVNRSAIANTALTKVGSEAPWIVEIHNCALNLAEPQDIDPAARA